MESSGAGVPTVLEQRGRAAVGYGSGPRRHENVWPQAQGLFSHSIMFCSEKSLGCCDFCPLPPGQRRKVEQAGSSRAEKIKNVIKGRENEGCREMWLRALDETFFHLPY